VGIAAIPLPIVALVPAHPASDSAQPPAIISLIILIPKPMKIA
jgi:hypothetical protein